MGPGHRPDPPKGGLVTPSPGSRHDGSPRVSALDLRRPSPRRPRAGLRCRAYRGGAGILTGFPFGRWELPPALGPANSRLTKIAGKTLPLRPWGFSPHFAATTARILVTAWSTRAHARASAHAARPPTPSLSRSGVSVPGLPPSIFGAPTLGRSAVTRCLADGCF